MSDIALDPPPPPQAGRWADYVLGRDDGRYGYRFDEVVRAGATSNDGSLYVMGLGYDPRATLAFEQAAPTLPPYSKVWAIVARATRTASRESEFQHANAARAYEIAQSVGLEIEEIEPNPSANDPRFQGLWLARELSKRAEWMARHVLVDVSSLTSPIFFALIRAWLDTHTPGQQLQVVAAENHWLDDVILQSGALSPLFLPGFNRHGQLDELTDQTRIWIPVLGHDRASQLEAINDALSPQEICPVLPFPAIDPRRGDGLVAEYGQLLFDTIDVDPQRFIYADAANPFDLYRALLVMSRRYQTAFSPLGHTVVVPSTHGSKLLSLGVLLGAFEADLSVANAGAPRSRLSEDLGDDELRQLAAKSQRTCLWLTGEPYTIPDGHPNGSPTVAGGTITSE